MKNVINCALAAKKEYTSPYVEAMQLKSGCEILVGSTKDKSIHVININLDFKAC